MTQRPNALTPRYYPLNINIESRLCVVIGGGNVAERKVIGLLEAKARIRVVSPNLTPILTQCEANKQIEVFCTEYTSAYLEGAVLIFAATNNPAVNAQIIADAGERGILANSASAPETGNFITPAAIRRGDLVMTVATGGSNPALASRLARDLEAQFGEEYAAFVELLGQKRDYVKEATANPAERKAALAALVDARAELLDLFRSGQNDLARNLAAEIVEGALPLASRSDRTESPQRTD